MYLIVSLSLATEFAESTPPTSPSSTQLVTSNYPTISTPSTTVTNPVTSTPSTNPTTRAIRTNPATFIPFTTTPLPHSHASMTNPATMQPNVGPTAASSSGRRI